MNSLASERYDTELAEVVKMDSGDLDSFKLKGELLLLPKQQQNQWGLTLNEFDVNDLVTFMQSFHISRRKLLGEISILGKLLLVLPATTVVGERSFSALRQGKTYFSSRTGDSRLDHQLMLHVHGDGTDAPTLVDGANGSLGRKKTERYCLENYLRTISQTSSLFCQSQH